VLEFDDPWLGNFNMPWLQLKKRERERERVGGRFKKNVGSCNY